MLFFWTFYLSKKYWKTSIKVSSKILIVTDTFNIDNNKKCFLSSLSAYLNDHVTLKTGVMAT